MKRRIAGDPLTRAFVAQLGGDLCAYCGKRTAITVDHIVPLCLDGATDWSNLTSACACCNRLKGAASLLAFVARLWGGGPPTLRALELEVEQERGRVSKRQRRERRTRIHALRVYHAAQQARKR